MASCSFLIDLITINQFLISYNYLSMTIIYILQSSRFYDLFNQPFVQHFSWTTTFQKKKINFMRGVVNDTHKSFFYAKSLLQIETFAAVLDEAKMHHTSFEMQLIRNSIVCINLWKNLKFCLIVCTEMFLHTSFYKNLSTSSWEL